MITSVIPFYIIKSPKVNKQWSSEAGLESLTVQRPTHRLRHAAILNRWFHWKRPDAQHVVSDVFLELSSAV